MHKVHENTMLCWSSIDAHYRLKPWKCQHHIGSVWSLVCSALQGGLNVALIKRSRLRGASHAALGDKYVHRA